VPKNYHGNCKDLILEGTEKMSTRQTHWSTTFTVLGQKRRNTTWHRNASAGSGADKHENQTGIQVVPMPKK